MIALQSNASDAFETLAAQLEQQAAQLAEARQQDAQLESTNDPTRWRRPDLLWPTFGKG